MFPSRLICKRQGQIAGTFSRRCQPGSIADFHARTESLKQALERQGCIVPPVLLPEETEIRWLG